MMVDSGSSVSIVQKQVLNRLQGIAKICPAPQLQLVTASGELLQILDHMRVGQQRVKHGFVVVNNVVTSSNSRGDFL